MTAASSTWVRALESDRGSAALEFLCLGIGLLVPLVYLVLALGSVQSAWMTADGLARAVVSDAASAESDAQFRARAAASLLAAQANRGLAADAVRIEVECEDAATSCPQPGQLMVARVLVVADLPFISDIAGLGTISVESSASQRVSRFHPGDATGWRTR